MPAVVDAEPRGDDVTDGAADGEGDLPRAGRRSFVAAIAACLVVACLAGTTWWFVTGVLPVASNGTATTAS